MQRYTFTFSIILLFFMMLIFPKQVFAGASDGLLLWFQIVLPTLFPFIIVSNLLIHTNSISFFSRTLGPFLMKFFHISADGSFAVLTGFLCGYPMGAKVTSDLILTKRITKDEGDYLLSFCNNTSPMFIVSYVIWQNLNNEKLVLPSILILYSSPILCSFLFRIFYKRHKKACFKKKEHLFSGAHFDFQIIDNCIMDSFETITKIGGYIILFSILLTLVQIIPIKTYGFEQILLSMIEITNGIPILMKSHLTDTQKYVFILALTSFGGFCSIAQTQSMIQESGLSIFPYIMEKLITALITSLFAFIYITFILQ